MNIQITVNGAKGHFVQHVAKIAAEGELAAAIGEAINLYRRTFPNESLLDSAEVKIETI